jgi:hypothetical protein
MSMAKRLLAAAVVIAALVPALSAQVNLHPDEGRSKLYAANFLQAGLISAGTVTVGMSRKAVILALGYPPHLENPSLSAPAWKYWKSRFDTMLVQFDKDDKVVAIKD